MRWRPHGGPHTTAVLEKLHIEIDGEARGRRSFAGVESSEQFAQMPLAELQFRRCLAQLVARLVGRPHGENYEHDRIPEPAAAGRIGTVGSLLAPAYGPGEQP